MSYRRRHRWFRRLALGLAFATAALVGHVSVAAARFDESTGAATVGAAMDAYLAEGVFAAQDSARGAPQPTEGRWMFEWGDVVTIGMGALIGIGAVGLLLGLGLALGHFRRPRLASP
jgi:hypothetical protein